jgi:cysteine desulfurase
MPAPIYLDNNATTPLDPRVAEAIMRAWQECGANPASQHGPGRKARRMLEAARDGIAALLGAKTTGMDADQVIFTSGGTEANNLALLGLRASRNGKQGTGDSEHGQARVIASPLEHPSVTAAVTELARRGAQLGTCPMTADGVVDLSAWREPATANPPTLVTVMLANNETGVIQPVAEVAAACRQRASLFFHTDAVQAVGKIPINFRDLGVEAMTVAPHKFHGPLGIGALVLRHGVKLQPQLFGGFQQAAQRPGTENVALAVGFHEALRLAVDELSVRAERMGSLRDEMERALRSGLPEIVIIGEHAPRLPNTSCVSFPGVDRQALVMALDTAGVACSTGSACASGSSEPSPTLLAIGLPKAVIEGAIRLSLGAFTRAEEVAEATRHIIKSVKDLRRQK